MDFSTLNIQDLQLQHSIDVNPTTGSVSGYIKIPVTKGRNGHAPSLTLNYSSSSKNSAFGLGWNIGGMPFISIDTKKGLPTYDGTDNFAFNGSESIVPTLVNSGGGLSPRIEETTAYWVYYYRAKRESTFTRFEKWVQKSDGLVHWRARTKEGGTYIFGKDPSGISRIWDPENHQRVFMWLLESQFDSKGNAIEYTYKAENGHLVDPAEIYERTRIKQFAQKGFSQKYPDRIYYGNTKPLHPDKPKPLNNTWLFELVFDYGGFADRPHNTSVPIAEWGIRPDPFSIYTPGFEVRSYRLCRRILLFHNIDELSATPSLTSIFGCNYNVSALGTTLSGVTFTGVRRDLVNGSYSEKKLPEISFSYPKPEPARSFKAVVKSAVENLPQGFNFPETRFIDLFSEGIPGVLTEIGQNWHYKSNLGNGNFDRQEMVIQKPSHELGIYFLGDFDRNGNIDLFTLNGRAAGYYEYDRYGEKWLGFTALHNIPHVQAPKFIDIDADGFPDIVVEQEDKIICYPFKGKEGFSQPYEFAKPVSNGASHAPIVGDQADLGYYMADMTGDGLPDQVRIKNGLVEYFPNLGHGRFGEAVRMANTPLFDFEDDFDSDRIRLYDLDGTGTTDIIYLGKGEICYWYNASGNKFTNGGKITNLPYIDNISTAIILDFLGQGLPCLVWSNSLHHAQGSPVQYLELTSGIKPNLLNIIDNGMGKETRVEYGYSGNHYLTAKKEGSPWISKIPSHFTVADKKIVTDKVSNSQLVTTYKYHDGHYNGDEHSFVAFGLTEQYDTELFENNAETHDTTYTKPLCTKTWTHNGLFGWQNKIKGQFYDKDAGEYLLNTISFEHFEALGDDEFKQAFRSLAGSLIRQEIYETLPDGQTTDHPLQVVQWAYTIRKQQPKTSLHDASFYAYRSEVLTTVYEQNPDDPRVLHEMSLKLSEYGDMEKGLTLAYARRSGALGLHPLQGKDFVLASVSMFSNKDNLAEYQSGTLLETRQYEINHIRTDSARPMDTQAANASFNGLINNAIGFDQQLQAGGTPTARIISRKRNIFWDDTLTNALPFGQAGSPALIHHDETACFNTSLMNNVYSGKVPATMVSSAIEGNYINNDGYWWKTSAITNFIDSDHFYQLGSLARETGSLTHYTYDKYHLCVTGITDPVGNITKGHVDYNLLEPFRLTDPNDNVSEVLYDPLGIAIVSTFRGSIDDGILPQKPYGNVLIDGYNRRIDESFDNVLNNPLHYLQDAGSFIYYDCDRWSSDQKPLRSIRLSRESLKNDGSGNVTILSTCKTELNYQDGFGRIIQNKVKTVPGLAFMRDAEGSVMVDLTGEPQYMHADNRWLVSGHMVYNNKQLPVRKFEPFFSSHSDFENDTVLENYGVSIQNYYDAASRVYRTDFPNSTFAEISYHAWETIAHDQNDTLDRSLYKTFREVLPSTAPERIALDKSLVHKETPRISKVDPAGREIMVIEINNDGTTRKTENRYSVSGQLIETIDARELTAFVYKYDMAGRLLYEKSIDAGEKWCFYDYLDQPIHIWNSRSVHLRKYFDPLGRPLTVHVDGALGLNQITERFVYGEDGAVANAKARNLRGLMVRHYDQAGIRELKLAAPGGIPLVTERRLLAQYTSEPDWTNPAAMALTPDTFSSRLRYDGLGRIVEQTLPDSTTREYLYGAGGGLNKVLVSSSDGALNRTEILINSDYDAKGRRQYVLLGNDVELDYTYDAETFRMNRLRSRKTGGVPRTYQDIHYTYDPVGNLVYLEDAAQQPTAPSINVLSGLNVPSHSEFDYDALYQLKKATGRVHQALLQHDYPDRLGEAGVPANWSKGSRHITLNNGAAIERYTRLYDYDIAGNIKSISHQGATQNWTHQVWTSASSNRSLPLLGPNGLAIANPESRFDANGNSVYMPHLRSIDWNYRDNLSKVVVIDRTAQGKPNDEEYYVYDGNGIRIRKITHRVTNVMTNTVEITEKTYLDSCEIKRVTSGVNELVNRVTSHISDGTNQLATLYAWTNDIHARETDNIAEKKIHYRLGNHLGSSSLELDEEGELITYEEYFPFGGTSFIAGKSKRDIDLKDYRYLGKERDDITGLYYFGYRYFAHWIGGWISPDPLGKKDSLNLYMYVRNNPVNLIDPNGLQSTDLPEISGDTSGNYSDITDEQRRLLTERSREALDTLTNELGAALTGHFGAGHFAWHVDQGKWIWAHGSAAETGEGEIGPTVDGSDGVCEAEPSPENPVCEPDDWDDALVIEVTVTHGPESEEPVTDPQMSHAEGECNSSPCETASGGDDDDFSRIPGSSGLPLVGLDMVYSNPGGFTLEVPNNFDPEKIGMYTDRIRTDRGVGNRSAVPGERLRPNGSDVTDAIRDRYGDLLDDWVDAEAAAGRNRPPGHHVDHGVELQHIIRGDSTGGADIVRFEDHRFQPGRTNTSQGSSAMHTRHRAVAGGAPEDLPAGGVARTDEMGNLANSERFRTGMRGMGHVFIIGGPVLSYYGASQIQDQTVRTVAYTTTGVEVVGTGTYYYGRYFMGGSNGFAAGRTVMTTGGTIMRVGGGAGLVVTSIYSGVVHFQEGEYGVLVGDTAGAGLGTMMLTNTATGPAVAFTGTAMAANYAGDYVESVVTPEYGRPAGVAAGTGVGLGIGAAVGGGLVAFGLVSNPVGWGILAVGGIAGFIGAMW